MARAGPQHNPPCLYPAKRALVLLKLRSGQYGGTRNRVQNPSNVGHGFDGCQHATKPPDWQKNRRSWLALTYGAGPGLRVQKSPVCQAKGLGGTRRSAAKGEVHGDIRPARSAGRATQMRQAQTSKHLRGGSVLRGRSVRLMRSAANSAMGRTLATRREDRGRGEKRRTEAPERTATAREM